MSYKTYRYAWWASLVGGLFHVINRKKTKSDRQKGRMFGACLMVIVTRETSSLVFMCSVTGLVESLSPRKHLRWHKREEGMKNHVDRWASCLKRCQWFSPYPCFPPAFTVRSRPASNDSMCDQVLPSLLYVVTLAHCLLRGIRSFSGDNDFWNRVPF